MNLNAINERELERILYLVHRNIHYTYMGEWLNLRMVQGMKPPAAVLTIHGFIVGRVSEELEYYRQLYEIESIGDDPVESFRMDFTRRDWQLRGWSAVYHIDLLNKKRWAYRSQLNTNAYKVNTALNYGRHMLLDAIIGNELSS